MKTLVLSSFINILGEAWMGESVAYIKTLKNKDIIALLDDNNIITRESVQKWINSNTGDFSFIKDFYADIEHPNGETIIINWNYEMNRYNFNELGEEY
jgi:hypothetical protein